MLTFQALQMYLPSHVQSFCIIPATASNQQSSTDYQYITIKLKINYINKNTTKLWSVIPSVNSTNNSCFVMQL